MAAFFFNIQLMRMTVCSLSILLCVFLTNIQIFGELVVNYTIFQSAVMKGAACLDGSPPAYAYFEGTGNGSNSWIIYLEGGGWCNNMEDCLNKSTTGLGSSLNLTNVSFTGLLDNNCTFNPDFYNWHKVFVKYCDGSSFMSDIENIDPKTNLSFRGARIFNVIVEEMLAKGMRNAQNAILTGTSAGGLATILHCDVFRALLNNTTRVKCISDSGFFIHGKGIPGDSYRESNFAGVITTHNLSSLLPPSCTSRINSSLCLFPEYLVGNIQTPLFLIESAFDSIQIYYYFAPFAGGRTKWNNCTTNIALCDPTELGLLKDFRSKLIEALMKFDSCSFNRGMYVDSCYQHGHILAKEGWTCTSVVGSILANKTIGQAAGNWYFDRSPFHEIDARDLPQNCTDILSKQDSEQQCLAREGPEIKICNA